MPEFAARQRWLTGSKMMRNLVFRKLHPYEKHNQIVHYFKEE